MTQKNSFFHSKLTFGKNCNCRRRPKLGANNDGCWKKWCLDKYKFSKFNDRELNNFTKAREYNISLNSLSFDKKNYHDHIPKFIQKSEAIKNGFDYITLNLDINDKNQVITLVDSDLDVDLTLIVGKDYRNIPAIRRYISN